MAEWARKDLASWKITLKQAATIFNDLGTPMEQREPDTRSDEAKALDATFPVGKAIDYTIPYGRPGEKVEMTTQLKEFDSAAIAWLFGAQFPRENGNSLIGTISKTAQLDQYGADEYVKLEKVYGNSLDEGLRQSGRMVEALENAARLEAAARSRGIWDSAMVASLLIQQATVYHARNKS